MTLAALPSLLHYPGMTRGLLNLPSFSTMVTLDAAAEYACIVFQASEAMTISHVGIRVATATGSPTADIRIETVDPATGLPTGTLWAANTNLVTGALAVGFTLFALTAAASISAGQMVAVKVLYASGTSIVLSFWNDVVVYTTLPYKVLNTGTPTKTGLSSTAVPWALGSSATTFYRIFSLTPCSVAGAINTFNNTNGARRGVRFQVPFKCVCAGVRVRLSTSVGDFNAVLFDDAGVELSGSSTLFEGDVQGAVGGAGAASLLFDNPVTLSPGTWYRAVLEPTSTTNTQVNTVTLPSADYLSAWPGGANYYSTTYASAVWTDVPTEIPLMDLLISQLDDGAGGGGGGGGIKLAGRGGLAG